MILTSTFHLPIDSLSGTEYSGTYSESGSTGSPTSAYSWLGGKSQNGRCYSQSVSGVLPSIPLTIGRHSEFSTIWEIE